MSLNHCTVDLKVCLLGRQYCGKTSLVERYLNNRFTGNDRYQSTIGAAYGEKKIYCAEMGKYITLGLWDTAGGER